MASSSVENFGQAWGSFIIAIRSLQSVPKCWQFECWSLFSNAHFNASNSECSVVSRLLKFRVPISWIFPVLSFHTQPIPLNRSVDVQEPSTMHILFKLKACTTSVFGAWRGLGTKPDIHSLHTWPVPEGPCQSPWIAYHSSPSICTRLSRDKGLYHLLAF